MKISSTELLALIMKSVSSRIKADMVTKCPAMRHKVLLSLWKLDGKADMFYTIWRFGYLRTKSDHSVLLLSHTLIKGLSYFTLQKLKQVFLC